MTPALNQSSSGSSVRLYVAMELGATEWKLAFSPGRGVRPRLVKIEGPWSLSWQTAVKAARRRFQVSEGVPIYSCYEAGRDGFWIERWLRAQGVKNVVVDSSSIEVNRRKRRAKCDRLDAQKLLAMLIRFHEGEASVWRTVRVPAAEQEYARHPHRELMNLKRERLRHTNRIKSHLATVGIRMAVRQDFVSLVPRLRQWDGSIIPAVLQRRLTREYERVALLDSQIQDIVEGMMRELLEDRSQSGEMIRRLACLRGVGIGSAWILVREIFGWRQIRNRRELCALVGLTPTPYDSGHSNREQGISKAGNVRVRWLMVELARLWRQWQPESDLSKWYVSRFATGNVRNRKVGLVALARKLLVALWRWLAEEKVPAGAVVVDWRQKRRKMFAAYVSFVCPFASAPSKVLHASAGTV